MSRRRAQEPSQVGSMLVGLGFVTILGVAFVAGVVAGRHWPRLLPSLGAGSPRDVAVPAPDTAAGRPPAGTPPALTFYQELTAPLTAPPPARPRPAPATGLPAATRPAEVEVPLARYAVQVAAFRAREPAEALRARLAAAGHDAYVTEVEGSAGARFRVRIGAYTSREQAQEVAERLQAAQGLTAYVTVR